MNKVSGSHGQKELYKNPWDSQKLNTVYSFKAFQKLFESRLFCMPCFTQTFTTFTGLSAHMKDAV